MKDTYYFSHDYNARTDTKIKKLIQKHGFLGYGLYWAIIEDLYQNSNNLQLDYDIMAYDYRVDELVIKSVLNDFELFSIDDNFFGSLSIQKRLDSRNEKSKTARDNANKRWGENNSRIKADDCIFYIIKLYDNNESFIKCGLTSESISRRYSGKTSSYKYEVIKQIQCNTDKAIELEHLISNNFNKYQPKIHFGGYLECYHILDLQSIIDLVMQCECNGNAKLNSSNAIKESKGKESKQNKDSIIGISCFDFDSFWKMYGKSADKMKCQKLYDKITEKERADIKIKLPIYLSTIKDKKFQKNPHTYLFGKCWNDIDDISEIQSENESQETLKELYPNCFWQINSKKIYYKPEWAK